MLCFGAETGSEPDCYLRTDSHCATFLTFFFIDATGACISFLHKLDLTDEGLGAHYISVVHCSPPC